MSLRDRKILTFDVVGTLIDFEAGLISFFRPIVERTGLIISDATLLSSFAAAEDKQHHITPGIPFTNMLPDIYRTMAAELGLPTAEADIAGLRLSMEFWPAFPDSIAAMKELRKHFRLVALTNADKWALAHFSRTLEEPFDDKVTAEDVEVCKPDPQVFSYVRGRNSELGFRLKDYLHVAQSQFHDIGVAKRLGYQVCWIERRQGQEGYGGSPSVAERTIPHYHFATLAQLVEAVEAGK
ncbi:hydrolase HAD superfamily protein [Agrobacterium tumefaciens CCNWGS0286]|uniref:HAD-IA family hydrolase n=1 Tax=Agrobacterium tumefaciens TaxID=358 RepID=UPI0002334940|nr:HAD-IA family hydrolase [Agrobacterium tumefaciens]EHH03618.1 hydrolase HAD superfamily protein [Agrobacterium tumefaciens CCNWGS0286]